VLDDPNLWMAAAIFAVFAFAVLRRVYARRVRDRSLISAGAWAQTSDRLRTAQDLLAAVNRLRNTDADWARTAATLNPRRRGSIDRRLARLEHIYAGDARQALDAIRSACEHVIAVNPRAGFIDALDAAIGGRSERPGPGSGP